MNEKNQVQKIIEEMIRKEMRSPDIAHYFREDPVIGYARADDPMFADLKTIVDDHVKLPTEVMPQAKTAVAFFVPFSKTVVDSIREKASNPLWSDAYADTNLMLDRITGKIRDELEKMDIHVVEQAATENFDHINLTAPWGHKSVAYISGIGTFGINQLIITKYGTAGRLSSFLLDFFIPPTPKLEVEYCLYKQNGTCGVCVDRCPCNALQIDSYNKFTCWDYLLSLPKGTTECGGCPAALRILESGK